VSEIKRAAIYVRVSTTEQEQTGYSLGEQQERLLAYCKAKGYAVYDVYVDGGFSGSNLNRPAIQKLKADMGKFDIVVVYKLDRLSRSQYDILELIEKTFLPHGVDFVSMSEAFDTSTPFGRAMIGILGVFAQLEREQIKERTMIGRRARAKEGKYYGGGKSPVGYEYDGSKLIPIEHDAKQIKIIFEMVAKDKSNQQIINALNEGGYKTRYGAWTATSRVSEIIKNDVYIGTSRFGDIAYENAHEAIVSRELFDKANARRRRKIEKFGYGNNFSKTSLLSGLVWCARCGSKYAMTNNMTEVKKHPHRQPRRYFNCYSRAFPKTSMAKQPGCKARIWRVDDLEQLVEAEIMKITFDKAFFSGGSQESTGDKEDAKQGIKKRVDEIDKQISRLMDLYSLDKMTFEAISEKVDELHKEKTKLLSQLEDGTPKNKAVPEQSIDEFQALLRGIIDIWGLADANQKHALLSSLINRIILDDDKIVIEWTFSDGHGVRGATVIEDKLEEKAICPNCGENKTKKYGVRDGKQSYYCRNKDCNKKVFYLD